MILESNNRYYFHNSVHVTNPDCRNRPKSVLRQAFEMFSFKQLGILFLILSQTWLLMFAIVYIKLLTQKYRLHFTLKLSFLSKICLVYASKK